MPDGLSFENVTAGYGPRVALRDATFSVDRGEVVGLVGPNGSGKTTAVRVASRALRPLQGRVLLAGQDPYSMPSRAAARLAAVVPQEVVPAFEFTAGEVVMMGRTPYVSRFGGGSPEDHRRVREAMRAVGIENLAYRPVGELSGGEKQRVILAQALAQDAPVLILDEPTTHLDLRHTVDMLRIVRELASGGRAILAVLHDLNTASAWCDRLLVLDRGEVVAGGAADQVITPVMLREVYGIEAEVSVHPLTGRPTVTIAPPAPEPVEPLS